MRLRLMATLLLAGSGLSCASSDSDRKAMQPYPIYSVRPQPNPTPAIPAPFVTPPPPSVRTYAYELAWYPRGSRLSPRWRHIVIHHSATTAGGARRFDKYHREENGWDELGYHFVIGNGTDTPDGLVEVGPRWHKQKHGAHCKTPNNYFNEHGIGICLVGDFTKTKPTPRQLASLTALIRFLNVQCGIAPDRLTTHHAIKSSTQCPGRHFDLAHLRRAVAYRLAADRPMLASAP